MYVGRPTKFGNPFRVDADMTPDKAVRLFRRWLEGIPATGGGGLRRIALLAALPELRGKDLMCFCPIDKPCHASVLLEIANR